MRMREEPAKPKIKIEFHPGRNWIIGAGVASIIVSLVIFGLSLWEGFGGGGKVRLVELPGFHEVELETAGLYAGIYQHRGAGPIPVKELSQMDVRIMSKGDYEEIPVLMNTAGQTYDRFGLRGMPLFNFVVQKPGAY